jgi:acylphosphatase
MKMKIKAKIIGPKVHNIGYRYLLLNEADNLGLKGFSARNVMESGNQTVLVLAEGDDELVAKFREFVQTNQPETAVVKKVYFEDFEGRVESVSRFAFRFQSLQVSKGINSILKIESVQYDMLKNQHSMLEKQDQMLEKQDESIELLKGVKDDTSAIREKQDQMLEKQDQMLEKQDQMLEKQDESVELLKGVKDDTSAIRDEIRQRSSGTLEEKYEQLSREIAEIKTTISEIKAKVS